MGLGNQMVVKIFRKTKDVMEYARELGFNLQLDQGRFSKQKKINGATWIFEGFVHSLADGLCNIKLIVRGGIEEV